MEIKNWLTIRGQSANAVCLDRLAPINSLHREPLGLMRQVIDHGHHLGALCTHLQRGKTAEIHPAFSWSRNLIPNVVFLHQLVNQHRSWAEACSRHCLDQVRHMQRMACIAKNRFAHLHPFHSSQRPIQCLQFIKHLAQRPAQARAVPSFAAPVAFRAKRNSHHPKTLVRLMHLAWPRRIANRARLRCQLRDMLALGLRHRGLVLCPHSRASCAGNPCKWPKSRGSVTSTPGDRHTPQVPSCHVATPTGRRPYFSPQSKQTQAG